MERECNHPTCGATCRRPKKEKKHKIADNANAGQSDMDLFWLSAEQELAQHPYCMECWLNGVSTFIDAKYYRDATAHVLPKRKEYGFPSIAANPVNRLFLGAGCGCHNRYDNSWEDAAQMKVWPMAVQKFKLLYHSIDPSERKNIPDVLLQEIDRCNVGVKTR